jgi:hypothetical protein
MTLIDARTTKLHMQIIGVHCEVPFNSSFWFVDVKIRKSRNLRIHYFL